jgi:predicted urease superfamily metal-dependent hydrolase
MSHSIVMLRGFVYLVMSIRQFQLFVVNTDFIDDTTPSSSSSSQALQEEEAKVDHHRDPRVSAR